MSKHRISIIGLGYVGLPLAIEFAKKYNVTGFDIKSQRISALKNGKDSTNEVSEAALMEIQRSQSSNGLRLTTNPQDLSESNVYIITVPTPIDQSNAPDLRPLLKASQLVGGYLKKGDLVIYESTVFPGCTEDVCVPVLAQASGLVYNEHFFAGYSPERINPGDKEHTLTKILKVTSGSTPEISEIVDILYRSIISAGTHKASSIRVAEAAKVIENSQRDINIAFMNELSKIFNLLGLNTAEVLEAAGTKWNFLKFKPGLVGGHCIGVDPYYLAQKAQEVGYHPEIILAGRRLNDGMGVYVASQVIKLMVKKDIKVKNSNVLILGFTFKENCPDVRNTKVIEIVNELESYGVNVTITDPWADPVEVQHEYATKTCQSVPAEKYDAIILAVGHKEFETLPLSKHLNKSGVIYDVKGFLPTSIVDGGL